MLSLYPIHLCLLFFDRVKPGLATSSSKSLLLTQSATSDSLILRSKTTASLVHTSKSLSPTDKNVCHSITSSCIFNSNNLSSAASPCVTNSFSSQPLHVPNLAVLPQNFDETDVAFFRDRVDKLSEKSIFLMIKNTFSPSKDFQFPVVCKRRFRLSWLDKYPWLRYSQSTNGAFCLPYVLFGNRFPSKSLKLKKLYLEPFDKWSDAIRSFSMHESTKNGLHEFTMPIFNSFTNEMSGKSQPINVIIDTKLKEKISKNRLILHSIVDTIIFCGRTNAPLRGHRDNSKYLPEAGAYSGCSTGRFNKLLNFAVWNGNTVLGSYLDSYSKNASYISKTS